MPDPTDSSARQGDLPPRGDVRPGHLPTWPLVVLLAICTLVSAYASFVTGELPDFAKLSATGLDLLAFVLALVVMPRRFDVGFLGALLSMVIAWRVGAVLGSVPVMTASTVCAVYFVLLYIDLLITRWPLATTWYERMEWQMTTLRIYFGFDMTGHFVEKIFAGTKSFHFMADQFAGFGLPNGGLFVIVGGLCELGIAIGIGAGFLTRLAGFGGALYFLIANHYGAHFENGFTWSNRPDGGWEYPMLMTLFFLSFALSGAGRFSIDGWLQARGWLPAWALPLCRAEPRNTKEYAA